MRLIVATTLVSSFLLASGSIKAQAPVESVNKPAASRIDPSILPSYMRPNYSPVTGKSVTVQDKGSPETTPTAPKLPATPDSENHRFLLDGSPTTTGNVLPNVPRTAFPALRGSYVPNGAYQGALDLLLSSRMQSKVYGENFAPLPPHYDYRYLPVDAFDPSELVFVDRLKRISLASDWMLSLGGSGRSRYMNEENGRLLPLNNIYQLRQTRLFADLWYQDRWRFFVEGIYADSLWHDLVALPIDRNRGDLLNLFVEGNFGDNGNLRARVGRQELALGSQRLISTYDWANTRQTFDGVRLMHHRDNWEFNAFWMRPVLPHPTRIDSPDSKRDLAGVFATFYTGQDHFLNLYNLYLSDRRSFTEMGLLRGGRASLNTLGSRYFTDLRGLMIDLEGAIQTGRFAGRSVLAMMASTGIGYHADSTPLQPTFWVNYDYASGSEDPASGTFSTFNQLFPDGHHYFGWLDLVGRQNIHDFSTQMFVHPTPWMRLNLQYHRFFLDRPRDALYNATGSVSRFDPTGAAGRDVGHELDFIVSLVPLKNSEVSLGYSRLFGGRFLRDTPGPRDAGLFFMQFNQTW